MALNEQIINLTKSLSNVTVIEWNFEHKQWINEKHRSISQIGQVNHCLYKYSKPFSPYTIFNDLDEYMYIKNGTHLKQFINENPYDIYTFNNVWAHNLNNNIPAEFETTFNAVALCDTDWRTKIIIKSDCCDIMGVHKEIKICSRYKAKKLRTQDLIMYHFLLWSGKRKNVNDISKYKTDANFEPVTIIV